MTFVNGVGTIFNLSKMRRDDDFSVKAVVLHGNVVMPEQVPCETAAEAGDTLVQSPCRILRVTAVVRAAQEVLQLLYVE